MEIPVGLVESLRRDPNEVVLFIGAGFSMNAGLPGWVDLVRPLADRIGYHMPANAGDVSADHLLSGTQYFVNQEGYHALIRYLKENLTIPGNSLSKAHALLSRLPVRLIFTTNYDELIERAYEAAGQPVNVLVGEKTLSFWDPQVVQVVKLCGDMRHLHDLVITKSAFNTFVESHREILQSLRQALITKTVLFLGYSMLDPFLNQIWDSIRLSFGNAQRQGYIVLLEANNLERKDLELRNIRVIDLNIGDGNKSEYFTAWLENLVAQTSNNK